MPTLEFFRFCIFLSVLFLFNFIIANSQTANKIDSLLQLVEKQKDNTNKIKTLLLLSREYSKIDPDKAMDYSIQAYYLASNLKYTLGIIDAIIEKSNVYTLTGQLDSALIFSQKAILMSDSIHDEKRKADSYSVHAGILIRKEGPSVALEYYIKALDLYMKIGDSIGYMNSLNGLGISYYRYAEYDSAIYFYQEFIKYCKKLKNEEGLGKGYVNLGASYYELKDFINARYYFNESIKVNEKFNNLRFLSIANNNLGSMAFDENNLDEAMHYYTLSQEQNSIINNVFGLAQTKNNIGNVHEKRNEYDLAFQHYNEAKDLYKKMNNIDGFIEAYKNIALIYERKKNYSKALKIYDSCLILSRKSKLLIREVEILYNIYKTYELTGDFTKSYKILTEQITIKDSIFSLDKEMRIKQLLIKYEEEKDKTNNLSLEYELALRMRTNQRNRYMYSGVGLVLVISLTFIFYRQKAIKDKIIAGQKIQQLEEEKKLLAARAIVDGQEEERKRIASELHDGLGVLLATAKMQFSTIKDKSPENRPLIEKAIKLLEQASGDVRKISHNMMPGLLTKFGFFEAVEDLFDNLNETEGLTAEVKIESETTRLPGNKEIMLYRIVQEMVNNTLRHAEAKNIKLKIAIQPNQLNLIYGDDGKGFNIEEKLTSKSIGLTSIQSRVKFLSGEIEVKSNQGEGVTYDILVPLP